MTSGGKRSGAGAPIRGMFGPKNRSITLRVSEETSDKIDALRTKGWSISNIFELAIDECLNVEQEISQN